MTMIANAQPFERKRRHPRTAVCATAYVVKSRLCAGSYLVENLSAGGALLVGSHGLAGQKRVTLLLQLPNRGPISLVADVVRDEVRGPTEHRLAVCFHKLSPDDEDAIQDAVLAILEQRRASPTVLVVDDSQEIRAALQRDLAAIGRPAVCVATPLELASWLQEPGIAVETVIVDMFLGHAEGIDVLGLLAKDYPDIRRVLMSGMLWHWQLKLALISGRAQAFLAKPWDRARLALAVGAVPEGPGSAASVHRACSITGDSSGFGTPARWV